MTKESSSARASRARQSARRSRSRSAKPGGYGPGHPETIRASIAKHRGAFEPEFWEAVRAAQDMD